MSRSLLASVLDGCSPLTLVDVGASGGPAPYWNKLGGNLRVVLFEPDPRAVQALQQEAPSNTIVLNSALSDSRRPVRFNLCRKQEVSSALLPNRDFLKRYPAAERFTVESTVDVEAETLDGQLGKAGISSVDFVKLDTEGFEWPILQGAGSALAQTIGAQVEVAFQPMRQGQVLFPRICEHLEGCGFQLMDLRWNYWRRSAVRPMSGKGQLIWADALFLRTPETLLAGKQATVDRLTCAFVLYHLFGYADLADHLLADDTAASLLGNSSTTTLRDTHRRLSAHWRVPPFRGRGRLAGWARNFAAWLYAGDTIQEDKTLGNLNIYSR